MKFIISRDAEPNLRYMARLTDHDIQKWTFLLPVTVRLFSSYSQLFLSYLM